MLANYILETSNAPGTGTFTLAGAATGRRSFLSAFSAGTVVFYIADDGSKAEWGYGTLGSAPNTLTRNVIGNTASTTALQSFTGAVNVFCYLPAERALWADQTSVYQAQARRIANIAQGTVDTDAARVDQVGDVRVSNLSVSGGAITVPLYNATDSQRVYYRALGCASSMALYLRVSLDGGVTYLSGASEYTYNAIRSLGSSVTTASGSAAYAPFTQTQSGASGEGYLDVDPSAHTLRGINRGNGGTSLAQDVWFTNWVTAGTPTHLLISGVSGSLTSGSARLIRRGTF